MKKIITLCLFAFAMILGTQSMTAQSIIEVNGLASTKTQELKKAVKFNNDTEDLVYQAYQSYVQKKMDADATVAKGTKVSAEDTTTAETMLVEKFKSIFSAEEYQRYEAFAAKQKKTGTIKK